MSCSFHLENSQDSSGSSEKDRAAPPPDSCWRALRAFILGAPKSSSDLSLLNKIMFNFWFLVFLLKSSYLFSCELGEGWGVEMLPLPLSSLINIYNKRVLFARPCARNRSISKAWPHPQGTLRGSQTCKQVFLGVGTLGQH